MKQLKIRILESGLKQSFIASKIGVSTAHLSMMLSGKATMPEDKRTAIVSLLPKQFS